MSPPVRIQLSRKKGWRMPPNTMSVARPGKHGNPFRVGEDGATAADCVALFRQQEASFAVMAPSRHKREMEALRGKNLACWCGLCDRHKNGKPLAEHCADCDPCHVDVLGELANRP